MAEPKVSDKGGRNELFLASWIISAAEFLKSAIKTVIKHKTGGTIQAAAVL